MYSNAWDGNPPLQPLLLNAVAQSTSCCSDREISLFRMLVHKLPLELQQSCKNILIQFHVQTVHKITIVFFSNLSTTQNEEEIYLNVQQDPQVWIFDGADNTYFSPVFLQYSNTH